MNTEYRPDQLRQLRYRMGWTQAEMARSIGCGVDTVSAWEHGQSAPEACHQSAIGRVQIQVESNSQMLQLQPMAEQIMRTQGLCQIHDDQVAESLSDLNLTRDGALAHLNFES